MGCHSGADFVEDMNLILLSPVSHDFIMYLKEVEWDALNDFKGTVVDI